MKTKAITLNDMNQVKYLWDYCFDKKESPFFQWYFREYCDYKNVLGVFEKQKLAGMVHLNPYTISLNKKNIEISYLVGIATAPEFRGKGVLKLILTNAFERVRKKNQGIIILMPISAGLYLPYDFAYCYNQLRYNLPLEKINHYFYAKEKYEIKFLKENDYKILQDIYSVFSKNYNGYIIRSEKNWKDLINSHIEEGGLVVSFQKQSHYTGYIFYIIKDNVFQIVELVALDNDTKSAMLHYAGQHVSQAEEFLWQSPSNDLTYLDFSQNNYYPVIKPFMMARVIDPIKALDDLSFDFAQESFVIKLTDTLIKDNNNNFLFESKKGKVTLKKTRKNHDFSMDIGTFTQLCFGIYSVHDILLSGRIEIINQSKRTSLNSLFNKKNNYINEYF